MGVPYGKDVAPLGRERELPSAPNAPTLAITSLGACNTKTTASDSDPHRLLCPAATEGVEALRDGGVMGNADSGWGHHRGSRRLWSRVACRFNSCPPLQGTRRGERG